MCRSLFAALLLVPLANANAQSEHGSVRVQHRVVQPSLPMPPWSHLATVVLPPMHSISPLGSPATLVLSDALLNDFSKFTDRIDSMNEGAMYQVALERPGTADDVWPTSVVKACHLLGSTSAHLTVHFSPSGHPFAVDHFVLPVPHDGSCPPPDPHKSCPMHNATVTLMSSRHPPRPELRTPPPLTPDGEPMTPAPEKSFLQKYWIYMVVVLGVLLVSGPIEEPARNGGGQGGR